MGLDVRLGLIGCGRRAPAWPRSVQAVPDCRLVALCDRVERLAGKVKQSIGDPAVRIYTDHRRLLADPAVDAVIVSVEPENQAGLAVEALRADKDVISEVPAAFTLEECWQLVLTVEQTGRRYYLAEQIRHTALMRYWQQLVREGTLGSILLAEGHYLHAMAADRFWRDPETGEQLTWEQARSAPRKEQTRFWRLTHPILYGPHELSPLLKVLDDRVVSVSCFETGRPSRRYREVPYPGMAEDFPNPDLEVALMQTAKGTVFRFAAGFQAPLSETHWYHLLGTKGEVETRRGAGETGHSYTYPGPVLSDGASYRHPRQAEAWFHLGSTAPADIAARLDRDLALPDLSGTGHGGADGLPLADFVRCLRQGTQPDIDVYQAVETAAPCILAAQSAEQGGELMRTPQFRPGPERAQGQPPTQPAAADDGQSVPPWFGALRGYAANAGDQHDLESIGESIARGRTQGGEDARSSEGGPAPV